MLQQSLQIIRQHFSPQSIIKKNIFVTKDYDYPSIFVQRLYISYLELEEMIKTRPYDQIIKKISMAKNDKGSQKIVLGCIYGVMLCGKTITSQLESIKQQKIPIGFQQNQQLRQQDASHENLSSQIIQFITLFRSESLLVLNNVVLQLLKNYFNQIIPSYRPNFLLLFQQLQKFSITSDDLFLQLMKTLNLYDQSRDGFRFNLNLITEFLKIVNAHRTNLTNETGNHEQQRYSKAKLNEQLSLMRHYLFGKLIHWHYMIDKMKTYIKGEWPYHLQTLAVQSLKLLKALYLSNPEECLVFSSQITRYAQFIAQDTQLANILSAIINSGSKSLNSQMIPHHYSLAPISSQLMIPSLLMNSLLQLSSTLYPPQNPTRTQKSNIHFFMTWVFKEMSKSYSESQSTKNHLLESILPDLVRWSLLAYNQCLELRCYVIQWVMYRAGDNEQINRLVRQAYFNDWVYFLKTVHNSDFDPMFSTLSSSLYVLNYLCFCCPSLAEKLLAYILGKSIYIRSSYQSGLTSQGKYRQYINLIIKKSIQEGIFQGRQILYDSQISGFIKSQLQLRMLQGNNLQFPKQIQHIHEQATKSLQQVQSNSIFMAQIQQQEPFQYYGDKNIQIKFNINEDLRVQGQLNDQEQDLIYTSHQFIPSSPSYHQDESPGYHEHIQQAKDEFLLESRGKREGAIPLHELQQQIKSIPSFNQSKKSFVQSSRFQQTQKPNKLPLTQPKNTSYPLELQKQFLQELGPSINSLLQNPTISQFTEYIKNLTKILKEYKKSSQEQEMIQIFLQQSAKIIYLAFNREFQSFNFSLQDTNSQPQTKEGKFITYFLLKTINQYWKQALTIYNVLIYKKLVKILCENFQSCEFTFYYVFLDIFKKGVPHYRDMKPWLFEKAREDAIVPILQRILGKRFRMHIYQNAQNQMTIPTYELMKYQDLT